MTTNYPEYLDATDELWQKLNGLPLGARLELFMLCLNYEESCRMERIYKAWERRNV